MHFVVNQEPHAFSALQSKPRANPDRVFRPKLLEMIRRVSLLRDSMADQIQPQKGQCLPFAVQKRKILNSRREIESIGKLHQRTQQTLIDSAGSGNLQIALPRQRFERRTKTARGSLPGQIDRDNYSYAEGDREHDERRANRLAR